MKKLVLIDGNAILHRAYHALPPLTTKNKEPINAVYGFISMLLRIIQDLEPSHLVVCFDRKEPTFRHKKYKEYQSHRPPTEEDLLSQFEKAKDVISSFNIPIYEKSGFEADDLLGTIAEKAKDIMDEVVIVTGDKDILQLVDEKVGVYLPVRGLSNAKLMTEEDVVEKLGVLPSQIVDYKGLVGDASDNYPGVYGIGPKTAQFLLGKYGNFESVYKNIDRIPKSTSKKLVEGKKEGEMSFELAKIMRDVSVKCDFNEMAKWNVGGRETDELFREYGFKTLAKRVKDVKKQIENRKQESLF